jgi:hypothetical protein
VKWLAKILVQEEGETRSTSESTPRFGCHLDLDVNTAPTFTDPLPPDRLKPLFEELVELAIEIAAKGDVA